MPSHPQDVVATGLPRSGTTLTCYLLNQVPDTVALHEPMDMKAIAALDSKEAVADATAQFFKATRESLLTRGTARSRTVGGKVPDNHVPDQPNHPSGLRKGDAPLAEVNFGKQLTPDFLLVVKHPVLFTGMLEVLVQRFRCHAVIRNPLAVLGSWNSVAMPVQRGHAPNAERLNPDLRDQLAAIPDRIDRQIHLLSWFFSTYRRCLPERNIVRYEEIVATGGATLAQIVPGAGRLEEPLSSRNASRAYDAQLTRALGERLLRAEGAFWDFYSRDSVRALLEQAAATSAAP